jgi:SEC-C motif
MPYGLPIARGEVLMDAFDALAGPDLSSLDPRGGVLVVTAYWRPRSEDPNPEQPGEKLFILSYLPTDAQDLCPCGSGKRFATCCQPLPYWQPVCPNPGMQGHSLMHSQSACFTNIPEDVAYAFLQDDERLYGVVDMPPHAFWIYWGDPAFDSPPYGTLCFGDLELQEHGMLLVTALSDTRMEVLLNLLHPLNLDAPQMQRDPFPRLEKPRRRALGKRRQ